jgi:hypothetical protein
MVLAVFDMVRAPSGTRFGKRCLAEFCNRFHYNFNIRVFRTNRNEKPLGETPKKSALLLCKMTIGFGSVFPAKRRQKERADRMPAGSQ